MAKLHTFYFLTLAALSATSTLAAIPVRWTVDTFRVKPLVYDCYHGETLDLAAAMTSYGDPLDLHGKTAKLYWQTNGMDSAYWSTNATVSSVASVTNVISATFSGAFDPGAPSVNGFIGVEGENYRAAFTLNFKPSPGFTPAHISPPVRVLDFATTAVANPEASPFMVKGGSGGINAQQATNIASAVVAPATNALASVLYPLIIERVTTNDVNAIIASSNLCTVAAAQAMTNDNSIVRGPLVMVGGNPTYHDAKIKSAYQLKDPEFGVELVVNYQHRWGYRYEVPQAFRAFAYLDEIAGEIEKTSVTNGGAKAYADANFLKGTTDSDGFFIANKNALSVHDENGNASTLGAFGIGFEPEGLSASYYSIMAVNTGFRLWRESSYLDIVFDDGDLATSNMVERIVASKPAPSPLTGKTYDFHNGDNFTKNLYIALTNVIQTLGGTVTNPPSFN